MAIKVGVIAEDDSDIRVAEILLAKMRPKKDFQVKKFIGRGCGKIIGKCRKWALDLRMKGCVLLAIIHDLDKKDEVKLRKAITEALHPSPIEKYVVVIPVHEIEAWLLADHDAINRAFGFPRSVQRVKNPHQLTNAKEYLGRLIYTHSSRKITYINTIHNAKIAEFLSIKTLSGRCASFRSFEKFFN